MELNQTGIFDKDAYYADGRKSRRSRLTIQETIHYDRKYIAQKVKEGFDTKQLKTFLIGGCFAPESIEAMAGFIQEINPGLPMFLLVTDINKEAFDLLKKSSVHVPPNITINMLQGDLTQLGLKSGSIDYIRMDFTQNFIPREQQEKLLKEQYRVLSEKGIVASAIDMVPRAGDIIEKIERFILPSKGSTSDIFPSKSRGYSNFYPSQEFIIHTARKAGFNTTF